MQNSRRGTRAAALAGLITLVVSTVPVLALAATADARSVAPDGDLWIESAERPSDAGGRRTVHPSAYRAYRMDPDRLDSMLDRAPLEDVAAPGGPARLKVPAPTGELVEFAIAESPVVVPEVAAEHPELATYAGTSVTEGYPASIRLDVTPFGFHASVRDGRAAWYVDPAYLDDSGLYLSYYGADLPTPERGLVEPELDEQSRAEIEGDGRPQPIGEGPNGVVKRREYRLALLTDRSYAEFFAPGLNTGANDPQSNAAVFAAKVTLMNRVNQIYNDDMAIRMLLIANTENQLNLNTLAKETAVGYSASGSGSTASGCTSTLLSRTQTAIDTIIGSANYDIGHLALGIDGGGIAGVGVVGQNGQKARGCTGLPTPVGDFMAIDYVAHEMGHQFAGNHTFNSSVCSAQRNGGTSVEPGSGSSVMAYAGICAQDDLQPHTDPYFSQRTQTEVSTYINGSTADTRGGFQVITTTNHNPDVTAPSAKSIPIRTPFALTGSATDTEGGNLIYLWEQNNSGSTATSLISNNKLSGPLFRVFGKYANVSDADAAAYNSPGENIATTSPSRVFPDMAQVLAGSTNAATGSCPASSATAALPDGPVLECYSEFLPTAAYVPTTMTFRLTARDLAVAPASAGGTDYADVVLTVDKLAGPLLATSQGTATAYNGNTAQTVTWNVNSTDKASLAPNVKISLSADGGQTFPYVLAASTPNDGSESVTIPNVATTTGRIKIEAVDNYFFDVTDGAITVTPVVPSGLTVTPPATPVSGQYSDGVTSSFSATSTAASPNLTATPSGLPAGLALTKSGSGGSATWTVTGTITDAPGSYPATISVSDGTNPAQVVPLTVNVTQENATVTYTGPTSSAAPSAGTGVANLTLTATVAQAADGNLGDLANATATFTDTTTSQTLCTSPVTTGGAAGCAYAADAPRTYAVRVAVGGHYTGVTAADTTLTVSAPAPPAMPDTLLTGGPAAWLLDTSTSFVFSSTLAGSTFTCGLDGASTSCVPPYTVSALSPTSHVFTVAASKAGQTDPTPASTVFTVPVDDTALKDKAGLWKRKNAADAYLGTYSKTKKKGAELKYKITNARALALVVGTAPKAGKVKVFLGKKLIGTVKLKGPKAGRQLVVLGTFAVPTSGKVKIVTSSKKTVRIEGLGVATIV